MGGAPAQWLVSGASELGERLVAAGCRPERNAVVMGARMEDLRLGEPEGEPADPDEYGAVLEAVGWDAMAAGPQRRYVARRDGRAVGVASGFVHGDTALGL